MFCITKTAFDRAWHALRGKARRGGERDGEYMRPRRQLKFVAMITALAGAVTAVVLATPGSGILSATVVARANFQDPVDIKFKVQDGRQEVLHVPSAGETVMQQIIIGPGGQTGWHSHPGPVVVLVKSGVLTFYSGSGICTARNYSAGQAFIDSGQGHVHLANNQGTENVELWPTYSRELSLVNCAAGATQPSRVQRLPGCVASDELGYPG
jgi:quercetin dioxygenase-like cupin family protein